MTPRCISWIFVALLGLGGAAQAVGEETVGTLSLDALSFVSLGDERILPIPSGSSIRFHFGARNADGTVPFTIAPDDVAIAPIPLGEGDMLLYALGAPTRGLLTPGADGSRIEFTASVVATTQTADGTAKPLSYTMPFTTESVSATNLARTRSVEAAGMRVADGARVVQLVGATTNDAKASHQPGRAVYTVLSGVFDALP